MISAIVLTHNDEATIAKTLGSLPWCDEILIIDDGSTDNTLSKAEKFTTNIFNHPLSDDFSQQRNFGLSKAKHEWVLFVDSDEVVTDVLAKEIQEIVTPATLRNDRTVGYFIKRRDIMWGREFKHGEQGRMKLLRLAKKDAGKWIRPVHEAWSPYVKPACLQGRAAGDKNIIGELAEPLLHSPHPNVAQYLEEINRYSTLNARYLFEQKIRVQWWQIVGYPLAKFFVNYIIRLGFLDGTAGAVVAIMMSFHSFLTRAKLWVYWHNYG